MAVLQWIIVLLACAMMVVALFHAMSLKKDVKKLRVVVDNQDNYTFLVNEAFEVKESNVKLPDGQPHILGNVLHCKNSHETGFCGEGEACQYCPVRFVIKKSFERHDDFKGLEACMEIEESKDKLSDVDVSVNGSFVCIDNTPHMVVNVKDITNHDGGVRQKVLFLSKNVALYDKVRQALGISIRVLSADTEHQALHRLLHAASYRFCAVVTDVSFYHSDTAVATVMADLKDQLPVFVFAKTEERRLDATVNYIDEDIALDELQKMLVATAV